MKTDIRRQARNRAARSAMRRALRFYRERAAENRAEAFKALQSTLDKAVNKGVISRNKAARLKSRQAPSA
jgi:ribosomal protein S20